MIGKEIIHRLFLMKFNFATFLDHAQPLGKFQVFIQGLLSAAVFRQRFSFFTVCSVKYPHEVGGHQRENF